LKDYKWLLVYDNAESVDLLMPLAAGESRKGNHHHAQSFFGVRTSHLRLGGDLSEELEFCTDEFRYARRQCDFWKGSQLTSEHSLSDAAEPLLKLALIKRDRDTLEYS